MPDYAVNRMGIVNCANEYAGTYAEPLDDPFVAAHFDAGNPDSIPSVVKRIVEESRKTGRSTQSIANALADAKGREFNPLWHHRPFQIVSFGGRGHPFPEG